MQYVTTRCMVDRAEELSVGHDVPMVWMDG